jgi:hypothetical protein
MYYNRICTCKHTHTHTQSHTQTRTHCRFFLSKIKGDSLVKMSSLLNSSRDSARPLNAVMNRLRPDPAIS